MPSILPRRILTPSWDGKSLDDGQIGVRISVKVASDQLVSGNETRIVRDLRGKRTGSEIQIDVEKSRIRLLTDARSALPSLLKSAATTEVGYWSTATVPAGSEPASRSREEQGRGRRPDSKPRDRFSHRHSSPPGDCGRLRSCREGLCRLEGAVAIPAQVRDGVVPPLVTTTSSRPSPFTSVARILVGVSRP